MAGEQALRAFHLLSVLWPHDLRGRRVGVVGDRWMPAEVSRLGGVAVSRHCDLVVLADAIDHEEDPQGVVRRAAEMLSHGGDCVARCHPWTSPHGGHQWSGRGRNRAWGHIVDPSSAAVRVGRHGPADYRRWFSEAGFEVVSEAAVPLEPTFPAVPKVEAVVTAAAGLADPAPLRVQFVDYILRRAAR